jgi:hypothetical protein
MVACMTSQNRANFARAAWEGKGQNVSAKTKYHCNLNPNLEQIVNSCDFPLPPHAHSCDA